MTIEINREDIRLKENQIFEILGEQKRQYTEYVLNAAFSSMSSFQYTRFLDDLLKILEK